MTIPLTALSVQSLAILVMSSFWGQTSQEEAWPEGGKEGGKVRGREGRERGGVDGGKGEGRERRRKGKEVGRDPPAEPGHPFGSSVALKVRKP